MHGGKSPGAPTGAGNGRYTRGLRTQAHDNAAAEFKMAVDAFVYGGADFDGIGDAMDAIHKGAHSIHDCWVISKGIARAASAIRGG
jgi:hypothetical protein